MSLTFALTTSSCPMVTKNQAKLKVSFIVKTLFISLLPLRKYDLWFWILPKAKQKLSIRLFLYFFHHYTYFLIKIRAQQTFFLSMFLIQCILCQKTRFQKLRLGDGRFSHCVFIVSDTPMKHSILYFWYVISRCIRYSNWHCVLYHFDFSCMFIFFDDKQVAEEVSFLSSGEHSEQKSIDF